MTTAGAILIVLALAIVVVGGVLNRSPAAPDTSGPRCGSCNLDLRASQFVEVNGQLYCEACATRGNLPTW